LDTEEILKRVREKRFQGNASEENIKERTEKIRKNLEKRVKRGCYSELKKTHADLTYVAHILAYTKFEKEKDVKFKQEQKKDDLWKDWKKVKKVIDSYPEDFQKRLLFEFAGESFEMEMEKKRHKMRYLERMGKKPPKWLEIEKVKLPKKLPEWYQP
jgi:hypothetical protein